MSKTSLSTTKKLYTHSNLKIHSHPIFNSRFLCAIFMRNFNVPFFETSPIIPQLCIDILTTI